MAYYSCSTRVAKADFGGPRGIRTLDLHNAIVARSQLRYGPFFGGAEGTRTPDLYSAIVALSQLSYSPSAAWVLYLRGIELSRSYARLWARAKRRAAPGARGSIDRTRVSRAAAA